MKISNILPKNKDLSGINFLDSIDKLAFTHKTGEMLIYLQKGIIEIDLEELKINSMRIIHHMNHTAVYILRSELESLGYKLAK